jgi:hypothetical protein
MEVRVTGSQVAQEARAITPTNISIFFIAPPSGVFSVYGTDRMSKILFMWFISEYLSIHGREYKVA